MPRRKLNVSDGIDTATLGENEQIVIEDKKTIRKERSAAKPADDTEPIFGEIQFEGDDDDEGSPSFSDTSLAALIYDGDADAIENQFCTILVKRKPDRMQDKFVTPCSAVTNYPPLSSVEITAERYEIEERVREQYGGGHYLFQIRFENRLQRSWEATLADLPATMQPRVQTAAATVETPSAVPAAPPPVDPMDNMLNSIVKMKQLKDALFGDEEARLKEQIQDLKREIENKPVPAPASPLPENLVILEKALSTNNETLQARLLDAAFPEESAGHWIPETVKTIFEHKEEIAGILGGLLGGLAGAGRPPAMPPPNIADLMRATPPASLPAATAPPQTEPAAAPSNFRRKTKARAEDGEAAGDGPKRNELEGENAKEETSDGGS